VIREPKLIVLMLALLLPVSAAGQSRELQTGFDDQGITLAVETELILEDCSSSNMIDVSTENGVVSLEGEVNRYPAKTCAADAAGAVESVKGVVNDIVVVPVKRPDYLIKAEAIYELSVDRATESREINVDVDGGFVTLSGSVNSYTESMLAGKIIEDIEGIRDIRNKLSYEYLPQRTDADIAKDIEGRLRHTQATRSGFIAVSIQDGRVELVGAVSSELQKRRAEMEAWVVAGVCSVNSARLHVKELGWRDEIYDYPSAFSDIAIEEAAKAKLAENPLTASYEIGVDVDAGTLWLTGIVGNFNAKKAAEMEVGRIQGIRRLNNDITVRPSADRSDDAIAADIREALLRNSFEDYRNIKIRVFENKAYLGGTVDSIFTSQRAKEIAVGINGVFQVYNELVLHSPRAVLSDEAIRLNIEDNLHWNPFVDGKAVTVDVNAGIATLRGLVRDKGALAAAEQSAHQGGALVVRNRLLCLLPGTIDKAL
jgi:osmotically-inducible protein OsmY